MRTNKDTITGPELWVDDHYGVYSAQIAWNMLRPEYQAQAIQQGLTDEDIKSLVAGPDDEWYNDAYINLEDITFKRPTGQKLRLVSAEGGIWLIPACFERSKEGKEFFNNS